MLDKFIENPFENLRIGDKAFSMFVKSHLGFLGAANGNGHYTDMAATLQAAYTKFDQWLEKYDKNVTNRKGKTDTIDTIIKNFKLFVKGDLKREVEYKYGKDHKEKYNEFFPNGLSEYSKMTKKTASILFDRIDTAVTKYKIDLPVGMDITASDFNKNYDNASNEQLGGKGNVKESSGEGDLLRLEIAHILYENLLEQLKINKKNRRAVLSLYDPAVLNKNKKKKKNDKRNGETGEDGNAGEEK